MLYESLGFLINRLLLYAVRFVDKSRFEYLLHDKYSKHHLVMIKFIYFTNVKENSEPSIGVRGKS